MIPFQQVASPSEHLIKERPRSRYALVLSWPLNDQGGVNAVVNNLIREFNASGTLSPLLMESNWDAVEPVVIDGDPPLIRLRLWSPYDQRHPWRALVGFALRLPLILSGLRKICRENKIEVLNPHFAGLEYFSLMVLRRLGLFQGKLLLSFHGSDIRAMIQSKGLERWLHRALVRGADVLVPCSVGLREEILLFAPECAAKTVPVQNGIDVDWFLAGVDPEFQLPDAMNNRRIVLSIGAFEYKKGHDTLLKAFQLVRNEHPDACLVIAGRLSADATRKLAAELGLAEHVFFFENLPRPKVVKLLDRADIFVLSSRWEKGVCGEGLAVALLEAAAARKPVVSTNSCGVSELISDNDTGLVVPVEDPTALGNAISVMLNSPERAASMAGRLHERVRKDFTWRNAHRRYLELAIDREAS